jgi:LmbE family N-acetylglucosaminyl deacetylase
MNVIAIGAHPDDIEILCAGTLALYAEQGHKVFMAPFTCGNMGDNNIPPQELASIRKAECEESAAILGASLLWPAMTDELVFPNESQRRIMIDLLREADPDVIITHNPHDYHPDHRYVSQLVFDSYFQKGLRHLPEQSVPACRFGQSQVYYMDSVAGIGFTPDEFVDITATMEIKRRMLQCHRSQINALSDLASVDINHLIDTQAGFRGFAAGCRFAEGFTRLNGFQRGLARRILP